MRNIILALLSIVLAAPVFAQVGVTKAGDARIRKALEEKGYKYKVTDAGNFNCTFNVDDNRTHLVFINSNTQSYRGMELREVWAIGLKATGGFSAQIANELLQDTERRKMGAWKVIKEDNTHYAVFFVVIDANVDAETLVSAIKIVIDVADEIEAKITKADDF
jgi:hypothetical protein